jgi:transposase
VGRIGGVLEEAMPKPYSADLRERVLLAGETGLSPATVAERFGVGLSRVYLWRQQARTEGRRCARPHRGGRERGIDAAGETILRALVTERNDRTLDKYRELLTERGGTKISRLTLRRILRRLGLWRKIKSLRASARDRADIQAERAAFGEQVRQLEPTELVFLDETGITTAMTRCYACAARGERAHGSAPGGWRRLTVLGALSSTGMVAAVSIEAAATTRVFLAFLERVLIPELRRRHPKATVLMDHLSAHQPKVVETALAKAGFKLLYLQRYSPDRSPIEPGWSKLKSALRGAAATAREALEAVLAPALDSITPADARGWFNHCGYSLPD